MSQEVIESHREKMYFQQITQAPGLRWQHHIWEEQQVSHKIPAQMGLNKALNRILVFIQSDVKAN